MRLLIEATEQELAERSGALVDNLCKALEPVAPDLADALRKASPQATKEQAASAPVLQGILKRQRAEYARLNKLMLERIVAVLEKKPGV